MARSDFYEHYPALLDAELADLDLSTTDAPVREVLMFVYGADKQRQRVKAEEDAAFRAAQRAAGIRP